MANVGMSGTRFYTVKEAAKKLGLGERRISKYCTNRAKDGNPVQRFGQAYILTEADLIDIDARRYSSIQGRPVNKVYFHG